MQDFYGWVSQVVIWFFTLVAPVTLLAGFAGWALALPLRREERARSFLHLLDSGLQAGRSAEHTISGLSRTRDRSLGLPFHLLAAHIEEGMPLERAIARVPRLLPPRIAALLAVGAEVGDMRRVIPACLAMLRDGASMVRAATNYQIVLLLAINPIVVIAFPIYLARGLPVSREVLSTYGLPDPPLVRLLLELAPYLVTLQLVAFVGLGIVALCHVGGPRLMKWVHAGMHPVLDWVAYAIPWRRRRMQRDFSTTLALLLDAQAPEARALMLAASATGNRRFEQRAAGVRRALEDGASLVDAVGAVDSSGELAWRLRNAVGSRDGFARALEGWHRSLHERAYQEEQAWATTLSAGLVLLNGLAVALAAGAFLQSNAWIQLSPVL